MTRITGADGVIALRIADVWGTAETCGAGHRIEVESIEENRNADKLEANPIGSGRIAANDAQQGAISPTISGEKLIHFGDATGALICAFYGGESIVTQGATGTYAHSFVHNETFGTRYLTFARQYAANSILECATAIPTKLTWTFENTPDYGRLAFELLGNDIRYESTTNTYAILENATTVLDTERCVHTSASEFLLNGQAAAALSSPTDRVSITSIVFEENKPYESAREFKGSAGNGEPIPSGDPPYAATLTVVLKAAEEATYWQRSRDGTEYKASFQVTGTSVGGVAKRLTLYFPRLKLIDEPSQPVSSGGLNPLTLTFEVLVASTIPSGMADRYPHPVLINTKNATWYADIT